MTEKEHGNWQGSRSRNRKARHLFGNRWHVAISDKSRAALPRSACVYKAHCDGDISYVEKSACEKIVSCFHAADVKDTVEGRRRVVGIF